MKLKAWVGNYDGRRSGLVIASSKEKARRVVGSSRADFDNYWTQTTAVYLTLEPETLYLRGIDDFKGQWVKR